MHHWNSFDLADFPLPLLPVVSTMAPSLSLNLAESDESLDRRTFDLSNFPLVLLLLAARKPSSSAFELASVLTSFNLFMRGRVSSLELDSSSLLKLAFFDLVALERVSSLKL